MKLELDLELCKKLLAVFAKHDLDTCSDENLINRYAQKKNYIRCTRCWLLNAVENSCPAGATLEIYAIIEDKSAQNQEELAKIANAVRTRIKDG